MTINVEQLDLVELSNLSKEITKTIASKRNSFVKELTSELLLRAESVGISKDEIIAELTGARVSKRGVAGEAKYKSLTDSDKTWTGRGRKPQWVVDFLAEGGNLEDLAI